MRSSVYKLYANHETGYSILSCETSIISYPKISYLLGGSDGTGKRERVSRSRAKTKQEYEFQAPWFQTLFLLPLSANQPE